MTTPSTGPEDLGLGDTGAAAAPDAAFPEGSRVQVIGEQRAQRGCDGTVFEVLPVTHKENFVGHVFRVRFAGGDSDTFSARELEALPALPYQED